MNFDKYIKNVCSKNGFFYSAEREYAENIVQDKIKAEYILWRNIVEDGSFDMNDNGAMAESRHLQIALFQDCKFDDEGEKLNKMKERILEKMFKFCREFYDLLSNENIKPYQPAQYNVGYDKNDANKVYCLLDIYVKTPYTFECL